MKANYETRRLMLALTLNQRAVQRGDIISLGEGSLSYTVLGVEHVAYSHPPTIALDIGEGRVFFRPDEAVTVLAEG